MNTKKIIAYLIIVSSLLFLYFFVWDFKVANVDTVYAQKLDLETAYNQATQQQSLKVLRSKRSQLGNSEQSFLNRFIPQNLHSGRFVYNLGQLANQNRLMLKSIQYTVMDSSTSIKDGEKKLMVELTMNGRYPDFINWLKSIETSDVLIDVDSFRGQKDNNNNGEVILFYVRLYAYGNKID
jgi:Tfp pilus assembly protein PilO